ncbi:coiled-coil domain-containing protein 66 [Genypterus blacodes]|uniref:coiled-coil domain-containing protein 66 n=1 Tax=Genypterus blacodes TaxID=154954 RepID=UPI003F75C892
MNLGDGLLFELKNGKPRLILLSQGAEKNPAKQPCRFRANTPSCVEQLQVEECPARRSAGTSKEARGRGGGAKAAPKVKSDRSKPSSTVGSLGAGGKAVQAPPRGGAGLTDGSSSGTVRQDSGVCLTNEQLEQILHTVHSPEQHSRHGTTQEGGGGEDAPEERENRSSGCLISWMEERQSESRAATDAKRAQWRRELDEQVALKQLSLAPLRPQAEEDTLSLVSVQSSISREPAVIRSSLRVGDVSPMAEALSVRRKEEERRLWLEELDKQREEMIRRRRQEKLQQSQTEDHERWASHFDSLHRKSLLSAPPPAEAPPARSDASSSLSLVWEAMSSCGAESLSRASVDTTAGQPARASYLRTMTALLDPAQIEERERRRLKQLEQQRAIEAQLEERRQQKEREEMKRRQEEQEEESKVELEREKLQRQYQRDTRREVHQAEQLSSSQDESSSLQPDGAVVGAGGQEDVSSSVSSYRHTAVQTESPPSLVHTEHIVHTPDVQAEKQTHNSAPHGKKRAERTGKENVCGGGGGGGEEDLYEGSARTDKNRGDKRRPEWNTQRPSRRFVPASERYPAGLQRHRQESRLRRQAELLALQDRNCPSRSDLPPPPPPPQQEPGLSSNPTEIRLSPTVRVECLSRGHTDRGRSPPVPAVKHRLQRPSSSSSSPPLHPSVLEFIPYVRTNEVFNLDPLEPAATPPPHTHTDAPHRRPSPPPLLQTELTRGAHTHRQQEILRRLAQLRQGLLLKQRELEADLNPRLKGPDTLPSLSAAHWHVTSDP